jgi:sugar-specific transcriptional regulator TrmB
MEEINFEDIGLTKNESKVYEILIKHGKSSSTQISSKSTVPYGRIYDVLGSLSEKGLVKTIPGKTKQFTATSPDELINVINTKEEKLKKIKEKANELKQFYNEESKDTIQVSYGNKGFWKAVRELKKAEKSLFNIKWNSDINPELKKERITRQKQKIIQNSLVRYNKETKSNVDKWIKIDRNIKQIENNGVAISIVDEEEIMIGLIKSNITIVVKDKAFSQLMKVLFTETYKNAQSIPK